MLMSILAAVSNFFIGTIIKLISSLDPMIFLFTISALTYILTYYFAGRLYGKDGTRQFIIKIYDSKFELKKQNKYIQILTIWLTIILWWILCLKLDSILKKIIENKT